MTNKPIIKAVKVKKIRIVIQYVFRANFNDTYWLEEKTINLNELDREKLTWFDPYNDRSNINNTLVAISYCDDEKMIVLEKCGDIIKENEVKYPYEHILCEDFDDSKMLAAHIAHR